MTTADDIINRSWSPGEDSPSSSERSWQPVDLTAVLDGTWQRPQPTVGRRSDGVGLLYPGKVHTISSESEAGKTWLALAAALDELASGSHVAYLDFEDDEGGIVSRLRDLQVNHEVIRDRFHYLRPSIPLGTGIHLDDLTVCLTAHQPTLVVIDGITEAMTLHDLNPLDNKDVARFGRMLPRRIAALGPAVVCLDHVVKDPGSNQGRYALGGAHKLNGLDGAAYKLDNRRPFGIGLTGRSTIRVAKDRGGQVRRHALHSNGLPWLGDLVLTSHAEGFAEVTIEPPVERTEDFRPTVLMGRVAEFLTQHSEVTSKRMVRSGVRGKEAVVTQALDCLILDGYVTEQPPYKLLRPYNP